MPAGRDRGAGGIAVHAGKIYIAGGLHNGAAVPWFDVYDPATNAWTPSGQMSERRIAKVFKRKEFTITVGLGQGRHRAHLWTTDLSYDYVRINASYRS